MKAKPGDIVYVINRDISGYDNIALAEVLEVLNTSVSGFDYMIRSRDGVPMLCSSRRFFRTFAIATWALKRRQAQKDRKNRAQREKHDQEDNID